MAHEFLCKPDGFVTVTIGEKEYGIENIKRVKTHANDDDSSCYWTIQVCEEDIKGNIKQGGKTNENYVHQRH